MSAAKAFYAWLEVVMKMQKPFDDMFRVQISEGLRESKSSKNSRIPATGDTVHSAVFIKAV